MSEDNDEMNLERKKRIIEMSNKIVTHFSDVRHVSVEDFLVMMKDKKKNFIVVDTRKNEERSISMIENAISVQEFEKRVDKLEIRQCDVICYCTIGYRSSMYARERSLIDTRNRYFNLHGSILAYTHSNGKLIDPRTGQETKRVHTFGPKWKCAEISYEQVIFERPFIAGASWYLKDFARKWDASWLLIIGGAVVVAAIFSFVRSSR